MSEVDVKDTSVPYSDLLGASRGLIKIKKRKCFSFAKSALATIVGTSRNHLALREPLARPTPAFQAREVLLETRGSWWTTHQGSQGCSLLH